MVEAAAEASDESLMDAYLESGDLSEDADSSDGLREAHAWPDEIVPAMCGSRLQEQGRAGGWMRLSSMMPSPIEVPPMTGIS